MRVEISCVKFTAVKNSLINHKENTVALKKEMKNRQEINVIQLIKPHFCHLKEISL